MYLAIQSNSLQDESQIKHALQQYKAATTGNKNASGAPSVESIQELLNVSRTVGNVRPKNLIKALQGCLLYSIYMFWKSLLQARDTFFMESLLLTTSRCMLASCPKGIASISNSKGLGILVQGGLVLPHLLLARAYYYLHQN